LESLIIRDMPSLKEVCVWTIPFPPVGVEMDTSGSPNLYFKDCVAPDLFAPDTINQSEFIEATSTEDGMIYLVPEYTSKEFRFINGSCIVSVTAIAKTPVEVSLSGLDNDIYWLYAIDSTGNISEPEAFILLGVGIGNSRDVGIRIYPNPTNTFLTIETGISGFYNINIKSLNGQIVYSRDVQGTNQIIDLSSFQKGIYFVTVRSRDYVRTGKIIKM